jgi:peptide deformylase
MAEIIELDIESMWSRNSSLRQSCVPIDFTNKETALFKCYDISEKLFTALTRVGGGGLAANQIKENGEFLSYRMFVIDAHRRAEFGPAFIVNPRIIDYSDDLVWDYESCYSIPGFRGWVARPKWVVMEVFNGLEENRIIVAKGNLARFFLHEYDHLNGILYVDRMDPSDHLEYIANGELCQIAVESLFGYSNPSS